MAMGKTRSCYVAPCGIVEIPAQQMLCLAIRQTDCLLKSSESHRRQRLQKFCFVEMPGCDVARAKKYVLVNWNFFPKIPEPALNHQNQKNYKEQTSQRFGQFLALNDPKTISGVKVESSSGLCAAPFNGDGAGRWRTMTRFMLSNFNIDSVAG